MTEPDMANVPGHLAREFAELNEFLYLGGGDTATLARLVSLAVAVVPDCMYAAVSAWSPKGPPRTLASTDDTAAAVNLVQHHLGDGPCLTAAVKQEIVRIPDLTHDERFPQFSATVTKQTAVRGVLSFHLVQQPVPAALSLFSSQRGAFDEDAFNVAALFAAHARVLLTHTATTQRADELQTALLTSRQIGAAVGILMNAHKIPQDEAFALLRRNSMDLNQKLRDVAAHVTETGTLPQHAEHPRR